MARRRWWGLALLLAAALALTGCAARKERRAAERAEQARAGALSALMGYLEGRRAGDLAGSYQHLSQETRLLYSQAEFTSYYATFPTLQWQKVGPVSLVADNWARVVVYDMTSRHTDGKVSRIPDFAYYVKRDGEKWGVALLNPALSKVQPVEDPQAQLSQYRPLMKAHPYSSQVHRQLFYLFLQAGDGGQAEAELQTLYKVSSPSDLPALHLMRSQFLRLAEQPDKAIAAAQKAIMLSQAYPEAYDDAWRSDIHLEEAHAHMTKADLPSARAALEKALKLNPANAGAKALLEAIDRPRT